MNNNDIVGRLAKEIMPTLALTRLVANLKFEGCSYLPQWENVSKKQKFVLPLCVKVKISGQINNKTSYTFKRSFSTFAILFLNKMLVFAE